MNLKRTLRIARGKIKDSCEELLARTVYRHVNELFEKYEVNQIRREIDSLREGNFIINGKGDSHWGYLYEKYKENYFPSWTGYSELNKENRELYFRLRLDIDEALMAKPIHL